MKQSMPSRIIGSGGGSQSALATEKAIKEDDGAGEGYTKLSVEIVNRTEYDIIIQDLTYFQYFTYLILLF